MASALLLAVERGLKRFRRQRAAEEPALPVVASQAHEEVALLDGLYTLGGDLHAERVGEADDAGAEGLLAVAFGESGDKAAVDFDDVDLEGVELGERGVARAEVVERETDPGATEARETVTVGVAAVEEDALGDFEDDGARGQPERAEGPEAAGSSSPSARNCTGERLMLIWKSGWPAARR